MRRIALLFGSVHRAIPLLFLLGSLCIPPHAGAVVIESRDIGADVSILPERSIGAFAPVAEELVTLRGRGTHLLLTYASSGVLTLWISYPDSSPAHGGYAYDPVHSLRMELPPATQERVRIDLRNSPAWSPWRDRYVLHVRAAPETAAEVSAIQFEGKSVSMWLQGGLQQLIVPEPLLHSSINALYGPRVFGISFSIILGIGLCIAIMILLLRKSGGRRVIILALLFLCAYDSFFSLDILRVTARDLTQWTSDGEYRYLGPVHLVADALISSPEWKDRSMRLAICSDESDILEKQLRYLLYPIPVSSVNRGDPATHLLLIATGNGSFDGQAVRCGTMTRPAVSIGEFAGNTILLRLL